MTTPAPAGYADWKAPAEDGSVLVWPDAATLLRQTADNAARLATSQTLIQGVTVAELRRQARQALGCPTGQMLIATGHQTELYHPGVWVKDVVVDAVAGRAGGVPIHFAVDTDQPKHLSLRWPGTAFPVTDDPRLSSAEWSGLLSPPTTHHLDFLDGELKSAEQKWDFESTAGPFLIELRRTAAGTPSMSDAVTRAQHAVDESFGLKTPPVLVSSMLTQPPWLVFVHHVLSRAGDFAADYNRALADYRRDAGVRSPTRPMPDLAVSADVVEVPFWLDDLSTGGRSRAGVSRGNGRWTLEHGSERFELNPDADGNTAANSLGQWLAGHGLRLSPRALTLTTFLRLLVVDQFVHGIGGGRYDQVADRLLVSHFKIVPPAFAVATATLIFPDAVGQPRVCLPCLADEGHRLRHGLLGAGKRSVVAAIDALPRRSVQRSLAFHNLHAALSAASIDNPVLAEFTARRQRSEVRFRDEADLFDRELFYPIQSRDRLRALIDEVTRQMS